MFKNLVKLQQKYPIGTKVNVQEVKERAQLPYYCEKDLIEYRRMFGKVTVIDENYCSVIENKTLCNVVDGYLFDGKEWCIAENTWDGWLPIHIDGEGEKEKITKTLPAGF